MLIYQASWKLGRESAASTDLLLVDLEGVAVLHLKLYCVSILSLLLMPAALGSLLFSTSSLRNSPFRGCR
jgi:hypothetical protein